MNSHVPERGAISTSHHSATEAGAAALRSGGNAVDAALAAVTTLCVVYQNNVALGGDLVALVRAPSGEVRFLNATGEAPALETLAALQQKYGEKLPTRGTDTVTVPGTVAGLEALHKFGATRSWADHFEAAIGLAESGHPIARSVAAALRTEKHALLQDPGCSAVFYSDGKPKQEGELLVQPELSDSLKRIATRGAREFYSGELARQWVTGLQQLGSKITLSDTSSYEPDWDTPLEGSFRGLSVITGPPNTSGFILLRALAAIEEYIDDPLGSGAGTLAESLRAGNAVRALALADPRFGGACGTELLSMPDPGLTRDEFLMPSGDTVGLSAVSSDGWAVSLISSVFYSFGAAVLEPQTGILFQNRGTSFSLDVALPNAFAPRKRPRHTLTPVLILRDGEIAWVPSTMGGAAQPQIHVQLLLRSLAGNSPERATSAPRWIVQEPRDSQVRVLMEEGVPEQTRSAIEAAGFEIDIVPQYTEDLGHSNLIRVEGRKYEAASDPRSDGTAVII